MTYRGFHYRVTLPLLAGCIALWCVLRPSTEIAIPLLALCGVVVLFTFPWDNWAVRRGLWDFPEERLIGRIDRLPIEEIAFFVLQTLQVSFLTLALCAMMPSNEAGQADFSLNVGVRIGGMLLAWLVIGRLSSSWRNRNKQYRYAWHLFYWFLPVVVVQWLFGYDILAPRLPVILGSTFVIGTLLSMADVWAVRRGIWYFDKSQITRVYVAGILPWEEVAFFYTTSFLVSQSILVLAPSTLR
jgi:lycopene cyclase domain-containing protein